MPRYLETFPALCWEICIQEGDKFLNLFRPPLTPPNLGGEMVTLVVVPVVVSTSPPKLGGVRGGLNNSIAP